MPEKVNMLYITASGEEEARTISRVLVSERLVSCVNILGGMNSLYWWEGKIQDDREAVIIAKTRETLVTDVIARVKGLHSYDCPCIVSLPVLDGNADYLDWVRAETRM